MLSEKDKNRYLKRYNRRLNEFGHDPRSLGWSGGKERQLTRFEAISSILGFINGDVTSILDVGCGFGDFGSFIKTHDRSIKYTGLDINKNLIAVAEQNNSVCGNFLCGTLEELSQDICTHDLVIASGIFNLKLQNQHNEKHIFDTLSLMFENCNLGIAADFMTDRVDWMRDEAFHLKPERALEMALTLSKKAVLRHDYLPYEYCLYIIK